MNNRQSDFVTQYRTAITEALTQIAALQTLSNEALFRGWPQGLIAEKALEGANADITLEDLTAAMSAASSILADIDVSEFAALYKVRV